MLINLKITSIYFSCRINDNVSEDFDKDAAEELISRFHKKLVSCKLLNKKDPNGHSNMISNLEKQFFVSSKNKSLYDFLLEH